MFVQNLCKKIYFSFAGTAKNPRINKIKNKVRVLTFYIKYKYFVFLFFLAWFWMLMQTDVHYFFCFLAALLLSEAVFLSGRKKCEIMLTFFFAAVYAALGKKYIEPHIFCHCPIFTAIKKPHYLYCIYINPWKGQNVGNASHFPNESLCSPGEKVYRASHFWHKAAAFCRAFLAAGKRSIRHLCAECMPSCLGAGTEKPITAVRRSETCWQTRR